MAFLPRNISVTFSLALFCGLIAGATSGFAAEARSEAGTVELTAVGSQQFTEEFELTSETLIAEEEFLDAVASRSRLRVTQLELLLSQRHASWTEVASARSTLIRDEARFATVRRFRKWLVSSVATKNEAARGREASERESVARLDLTLPGSRAILGWLRPEGQSKELREVLFGLLMKRGNLLVESTHEVEATRLRVQRIQEKLNRLNGTAVGNAAEIQRLELDLRVEKSKALMAVAHQQRREREQQLLERAIAVWRTSEVPAGNLSGDKRSNSDSIGVLEQEHRQRIVQILAIESGSEGELKLARIARRMSDFVASGNDALAELNFVSLSDKSRDESSRARSWMKLDQLQGRKSWLSQLELQYRGNTNEKASLREETQPTMGRRLDDDSDGPGTNFVNELASRTNVFDRPLVRKGIELARQWYDIEAERQAAEAELEWRNDLLKKLAPTVTRVANADASRESDALTSSTDSSPINVREVEAAQSAFDFCQARIQFLKERRELLKTLFDQLVESSRDSSSSQMSLVGELEAEWLMSSSRQRADRLDASSINQKAVVMERRVEGLAKLRELGHASVEELAEAQLEMNATRIERQGLSFQLQLEAIDHSLLQRILEAYVQR